MAKRHVEDDLGRVHESDSKRTDRPKRRVDSEDVDFLETTLETAAEHRGGKVLQPVYALRLDQAQQSVLKTIDLARVDESRSPLEDLPPESKDNPHRERVKKDSVFLFLERAVKTARWTSSGNEVRTKNREVKNRIDNHLLFLLPEVGMWCMVLNDSDYIALISDSFRKFIVLYTPGQIA